MLHHAGCWGTRGGGTRGREGGGKWSGLDPVVPVTNAELLDSVAAFYGCAACLLSPPHLLQVLYCYVPASPLRCRAAACHHDRPACGRLPIRVIPLLLPALHWGPQPPLLVAL